MGKVDDAAALLELSMKVASLRELARKLDIAHEQLEETITLLESKELIRLRHKNKDTGVHITDRGLKFLDLYNSLRSKFLMVPAE